ncbi:MAG: polysaccharide deacetylase family protein [Clostridia bacterium]|nr:polysaccharide deacetylase family protein [Clostridia bacterium]
MKIFVLTKKSLLVAAVFLLAACFALPTFFQSVETSISTKELPIYSVETSDKKIAVTFDSAWNDDDIDKVLKALNDNNCPSTFFVTGDWAERFPESLKKLHSAGHEIGSHSYNHTLYSTLSKDEIIADMDKCDSCIEAVIGIRPTLVRAPSGDYTNNSILACKETNRYCIQWDVDSLDWKELTEEEMKARIFEKVKPGSILLFHNGTKQTADALPGILTALKNEGYTFVKVGDLIYKENYTIDHMGRQHKASP